MGRKGAPNRITVTLTEDLKKWYDDSADEMGLTTNAFIVMALTKVKQHTIEAIETYHANK